MAPARTRLEVEITNSDIEEYHTATHRKLRGADQGLSLFFVSRWLASPVVKAEIENLCPPGRLPVHVRQLSRRLREVQADRLYTVEVDYHLLPADISGVRLEYRVLEASGNCAADGKIELHFLERSMLMELVE